MKESVPLYEACDYIVDCEHRTAPIDESGDFFAVGTPAMRDGVIDFSQARRISKETFMKWTRRLAPRHGDLLFAREAPVGPLVRIPIEENVAPGQRTVLMRPNPEVVNSTFLFYLLGSPVVQRRVLERAAGSTVAHLNVADIRAFELPPLPGLETQCAIAEVLGALDDKIAANRKLATTADALATSLFARLDNVNSPAELMGEVLSLEYGKALPASQRVHGLSAVYGSGGVVGSHNESLLEGPAVIVGRKGTIGAVHWSNGPCFPIDTTFFVRPNSERVTLEYCYYLLRSLDWADFNSDSAVPGLNRSQALKRKVLMPSIREIERFTSDVQPLLKLQESVDSESMSLVAMRDTLLPPLMSGELRVRDAERVVENVL
ncbi:restriction endonuclease subunit S [Rhodococcus coprophilus]|uniref:Type I restriction-modification system specificity subunit n=2 Tax=Rhodococcus coprophilus TaxID=38310 RepID=A0A2X4TWE5_9NOCA|nr:restriction endonuclease subunit S [Rhodococcus coprophilus]MBM7458156.1 type I restriction enzyme S subunit [Rhodococcus coprophilus]SQI31223.1 type I restriction-modification system specificity subunit [Rhodococcus coprophilus]